MFNYLVYIISDKGEARKSHTKFSWQALCLLRLMGQYRISLCKATLAPFVFEKRPSFIKLTNKWVGYDYELLRENRVFIRG